MNRPPVSQESLLKAMETVAERMGLKLEKHGNGAYVSHHEMLGIITEEYLELSTAIHDNDVIEVGNELHDIAVSAIFSIASLYEKEEKAAQKELEETLAEVK